MRQHMSNSIEVAKYLQTHPKIEEVVHPGKNIILASAMLKIDFNCRPSKQPTP
jgi:cystathionine beta-lyase/cystathionine gamma-synthase